MAPVMKPKVVISQDGFDGAVKENMEDFDMSLAEAVEDAIKTFQMQGANLSGQDTWTDEWMRAFFVHCVHSYGDFECGLSNLGKMAELNTPIICFLDDEV